MTKKEETKHRTLGSSRARPTTPSAWQQAIGQPPISGVFVARFVSLFWFLFGTFLEGFLGLLREILARFSLSLASKTPLGGK